MKRGPRGGFRILKLDASSQRQCHCGIYLLVERVRIGEKHFVNIVFFLYNEVSGQCATFINLNPVRNNCLIVISTLIFCL